LFLLLIPLSLFSEKIMSDEEFRKTLYGSGGVTDNSGDLKNGLSSQDVVSKIIEVFNATQVINDAYLYRLEGFLKNAYVVLNEVVAAGSVSVWGADYYKRLSHTYGLAIKETEFYNSMLKIFKQNILNLSAARRSDFLYYLIELNSLGGDRAIFFLIVLLEKNGSVEYSLEDRVFYTMLRDYALWLKFSALVADHFQAVKSIKGDNIYEKRYESDKALNKLNESYEDYFFNLRVPSYKKIDGFLGIKD